MSQMMANLPLARFNPAHPFLHVRIDYARPIKIRPSAGRDRISIKGYVTVFVCLFTKAIHLEAVSSYEIIHFLNSFN